MAYCKESIGKVGTVFTVPNFCAAGSFFMPIFKGKCENLNIEKIEESFILANND